MNHLDYIQGLGAEAIWIGPVFRQAPRGYMGYWPMGYTELNEHFGTEQDLKDFIGEIHRRGMLVMVGVTANSMGSRWADIRHMDPPWNDTVMFHDCDRCFRAGGGKGGKGCIRGPDGQNELCDCWVSDYLSKEQCSACQLYGLPDVNEENPKARAALLRYVRTLKDRFDIDGIRVDAVPYMGAGFWKEFTDASGVFSIGEISSGDNVRLQHYLARDCFDSAMNYPLYYRLKNCFTLRDPPASDDSDHLWEWYNSQTQRWSLKSLAEQMEAQRAILGNTPWLGNFAENHDEPRLMFWQRDPQLRKGFILYVLTSVGMPIIYQGLEQDTMYYDHSIYGDDGYRPPLWTSHYRTKNSTGDMYQWVATVGRVRTQMPRLDFADADHVTIYSSHCLLGFVRGLALVVLTNVGQNGPDVNATMFLQTWNVGQRVCNIFDKNDCLTVQASYLPLKQSVTILLRGGESKVYVPAKFVL